MPRRAIMETEAHEGADTLELAQPRQWGTRASEDGRKRCGWMVVWIIGPANIHPVLFMGQCNSHLISHAVEEKQLERLIPAAIQ